MSRKSYLNVNAANQYARNVVRGKFRRASLSFRPASVISMTWRLKRVRNFVTASIKTWQKRPRNLSSCCHIQKESGHSSGCRSLWRHGNCLLCAAPLAGSRKGRSFDDFARFTRRYRVKMGNQLFRQVWRCTVLPVITSLALKYIPGPQLKNRRGKYSDQLV